MLPWDFWRMTPKEFAGAVAGAAVRSEQRYWRAAWHAANVMNIHLKRAHRVTPARLLGKVIASTRGPS